METDKTFPENQIKVKVPKLLFPIIVGLSLITGTLFTWQLLSKEENSHIERFTQLQLTSVKHEIASNLEADILSLLRMAKRWEKQGGTPKEAWESDATFYFKHSKVLQAVEWIDTSFHVRWIVPLEGNEAAKDIDLSKEEQRRIALEKARDSGEITMTSSIELVQGGKGFLVFLPIFKGNNFDGFILGVFRYQPLFDKVLEAVAPGFLITIYDRDEKIYYREIPGSLHDEELCMKSEVELYGIIWRLCLCPGSVQFRQMRSYIPVFLNGF